MLVVMADERNGPGYFEAWRPTAPVHESGQCGRGGGGVSGGEGKVTCYDGPENENNETKQCRAYAIVN